MKIHDIILREIERGGHVDDSVLQDLQRDKFKNPQHDLFPEIPTLEPGRHPDYEQVGRIGGFYVLFHKGERDYLYVLVDKSKVIAWVALIDIGAEYQDYPFRNRGIKYHLRGRGLQISGVFVDPAYQGGGLSILLYEWILKHACDYIARDSTHTPGGEAIWRKMLNRRRFDVYVYDPEKEISRRRWPGRDWEHVYNKFHLSPWVTLNGKAKSLMNENRR